MAKQLTAPRYIFKIHTDRLKKAKWNLEVSLDDARRNEEVIALNDSQVLRWIDELNGVVDADSRARELKRRIRFLRKQPDKAKTRKECKALYAELDALLFKPDYVHIVVDHDKDLYRACKGFSINGISFRRLVGTNGGVKNSTIVFVSERLIDEIRRRIDNGRDQSVPQIPSKFEAYRALTCSGSTPVSMPKGILVVADCETTFKENIIMLSDEADGEPVMQYIEDYEITLDESDGYGLMSPALAERWSHDLGLNYTASAFCTRCSWEKGMVFTFDFCEFAEMVAGKYTVTDVWGKEIDIREVELVLTTSMLKLWKCYNSIDHYLDCCEQNHYTFGVTKAAPKELDTWRHLNYQFIQSFDLSDEQVDELIEPTMKEIHDVLVGDYRSALLFLRGKNVTENNVLDGDANYVSAMMIDERMFGDPFVKHKIYNHIKKRIANAKIGVIGVHGNFSLVCGDPYALCQSMFGLEVTGLLKAGQLYSQYWADCGADAVACFRAPMSNHNNIKRLNVAATDEMRHWYRHITTGTLLNAWDTTSQALNGMDKDGDLIFLTDNRILTENVRNLPTIFCIQRTGEKIEPTEEDLVKSNILGFGDEIGKTTNRVTSMFDVMSRYPKDSDEYRALEYRVMCGQLYQQNAIDKLKGIISKPMPRYWFDRHQLADLENNASVEPHIVELNRHIVADKKPYFMRYIYPALMYDYKTYQQQIDAKCMMMFGMMFEKLRAMPDAELTDEQRDFIRYNGTRYPVSMDNCVMNRICRRFEAEFDGIVSKTRLESEFDYSFLKTGHGYRKDKYYQVKKLHDEYKKWVRVFMGRRRSTGYEDDDFNFCRSTAVTSFARRALEICTNVDELQDIVLDLCYKSDTGKQFVWDVCGDDIIESLLKKNEFKISYPVLDPEGDIEFSGDRFSMVHMEVDKCQTLK